MAVEATPPLPMLPPVDGQRTARLPPLPSEPELERALLRLEWFLRWFGFCQNTKASIFLSWLAFALVGIVAPILIVEYYYCYSDCEKYQVKSFEVEIVACQAVTAAVSLVCVSHNLRKYGVRNFIFVDRRRGYSPQFYQQYVEKINHFFRLLATWVLPCFLLKTGRELVRVAYVHHDSAWEVAATLIVLLISWFYTTMIYLIGGVLFHLMCNLQGIHFENYAKILLERDADISYYLEEHMRLTFYLSKISHRFRLFLIAEFVVVTANQCIILIETTSSSVDINIINTADPVISSIVQVVGITICLHGATKISHRAQSLASVAGKWHALVTSSSNESSHGALVGTTPMNGGHAETIPDHGVHISIDCSESDVDSSDYFPFPNNVQLASYMSTYHKRQAFVLYLLTNPGGVTLYGWTVDRGFLTTVFCIELSLVTCILGNTLSLSTSSS